MNAEMEKVLADMRESAAKMRTAGLLEGAEHIEGLLERIRPDGDDDVFEGLAHAYAVRIDAALAAAGGDGFDALATLHVICVAVLRRACERHGLDFGVATEALSVAVFTRGLR